MGIKEKIYPLLLLYITIYPLKKPYFIIVLYKEVQNFNNPSYYKCNVSPLSQRVTDNFYYKNFFHAKKPPLPAFSLHLSTGIRRKGTAVHISLILRSVFCSFYFLSGS